MSCPRCAALEARVAELERRLALTSRADRVTALKADLGVSDSEARVLICLTRTPGYVVPRADVMRVMDTRSQMSCKTRLSNLRRKLKVGSIKCVDGGYRASDALTKVVWRVLAD